MAKNIFSLSKKKLFLLISFLLLLSLFLSCSERKKPISIGFVGGTTGRVADLGIAGRDGVLLAVEKINRSGGIQGRPVQLIVKDDKQDPDSAKKAVEEMIEEGVVAIIGHMTSSMSVATASLVNEREVLMISPTTSTNELTGINDSFFRVYPASAQLARLLANHVNKTLKLKRVTVVYDLSNRAYTEDLYLYFKDEFEKLGGVVNPPVSYRSGGKIVFADLAGQVSEVESDCYFIVANAMDTAMLSQHLRRLGKMQQIITGEWSVTEEILEYGGKAVEGIQFYHTFDKKFGGKKYQEFRESFSERFLKEPGFAAVGGYDAAMVLFNALRKNSDPSLLARTIIDISWFDVLQGRLLIDNWGDAEREFFLMTIHKGQFLKLENVHE